LKTLLVVAHPRSDSLTAAAAARFAETIGRNGREEDEPDWDDPDKRYSPAVQAEMRRIEANDATVMIFPVWWWSMPALLKGWIDRVWNHGWAYGARKIPARRIWMIAIAGGDAALFRKRDYDKAIEIQLKVGVLDYCGVSEGRLEVLYGALDGEAAARALLAEVERIASEF
jgi:NAD(P)H dehydrogenase (quinone)